MPCRSAEALARKKAARKVRDAAKRKMLQDCKAQSMRLLLDPIKGWKKSNWSDKTELKIIGDPEEGQAPPNLTLVDSKTGQVIMQRLAPTSEEMLRQTKASARKGEELLSKYLAKKNAPPKRKQKQPAKKQKQNKKRNLVEHHLGIWHGQGKVSLNFTSETTNSKYRDEAFKLLNWTKDHADLVLTPLKSKIDHSFHDNLDGRAPAREWAKLLFDEQMELLHKWWTTVAFFTGFAASDGVHVDKDDCIPSFLFSFGEEALLALPQFGISVRIQPNSTVILNSRSYHHRTLMVGSGTARWAFSGFFRTAIYNQEPISVIAHDKLAALLAQSPA